MREPERPGEELAWYIDKFHWNQAMFSEVIGRPVQFVSDVVNGKTRITRTSAAQFAAALGTTAQHWLDLQNEYELWVLSRDKEMQKMLRGIKRRAKAYTVHMPVT
ncbi:HigA family addiction module antitoxin [Pseudarthrobacter sp. efr-133-R2A-89]|jgi:HTH-type transcriptional regulator/antitoxin HigA|uniref:HigA family addiction module antitoxin n=1 Tax=Pseudarthrobacter sp. efr-133-R2A-89 TaxID=3040302 RepID=UPI0025576CF0|nr:HigA family addiction module antitoxin [Pseudarthrobacter sp. efr-133-R2A-89]